MIIGKINDRVLLDDAVLREPEIKLSPKITNNGNKISLKTIAFYQGKEYDLQDLLNNLLNQLQKKDNIIEKATNKVQYIIDIGFDYDGYNDVDNLKILVDELVDLAKQTKNILNGRSDE